MVCHPCELVGDSQGDHCCSRYIRKQPPLKKRSMMKGIRNEPRIEIRLIRIIGHLLKINEYELCLLYWHAVANASSKYIIQNVIDHFHTLL